MPLNMFKLPKFSKKRALPCPKPKKLKREFYLINAIILNLPLKNVKTPLNLMVKHKIREIVRKIGLCIDILITNINFDLYGVEGLIARHIRILGEFKNWQTPLLTLKALKVLEVPDPNELPDPFEVLAKVKNKLWGILYRERLTIKGSKVANNCLNDKWQLLLLLNSIKPTAA